MMYNCPDAISDPLSISIKLSKTIFKLERHHADKPYLANEFFFESASCHSIDSDPRPTQHFMPCCLISAAF